MALTTIDGKLCCPQSEYNLLCVVQGLESLQNSSVDYLRMVAQAGRELGRRVDYASWPDWFLLRELRRVVQPAYCSARAEIGEEDVDGSLYQGDGLPGEADISPIGPASLFGKVALELCRRFEKELRGDSTARARVQDVSHLAGGCE